MRCRILDEIMAEFIIYGGMAATRWEVYQDARALGMDTKWADWTAFRQEPLDPETVAQLPRFDPATGFPVGWKGKRA